MRLVTSNLTFRNIKSASIFRSPSILRQNFRDFVRAPKTKSCTRLFISRPLALTLGLTSVIVKSHFSTAQCESNRTTELSIIGDTHLKFDWIRFWRYLKVHIWKLLGAIFAALAVAYLNISIPSLLGQLVNALSKYAGDSGRTAQDFLQVRSDD